MLGCRRGHRSQWPMTRVLLFRTSSDHYCNFLKVHGSGCEFEVDEISWSLSIYPSIIIIIILILIILSANSLKDSVLNSSGSLCCWCGVPDSGEDEVVLLQGRAKWLAVQHSHHQNHWDWTMHLLNQWGTIRNLKDKTYKHMSEPFQSHLEHVTVLNLHGRRFLRFYT